MTDAAWSMPIEQLAPRIRERRLSPVALTQAYLDRIAAEDRRLQSFVAVADGALDEARCIERAIAGGRYKGSLHGVPVAVKDNYMMSGMQTRAGTSVDEIAFPDRDSTAVRRLKEAGAIVIGKTRMHEFAWGNVTPPTRNPWNTNCVPGGSSGGSGAAVAAQLCAAALGSDTGGSIRIPASLCGVVGLKPTFGRIGRSGIVPHSWSLDHAGPLAQTVTDAAFLLQALAGPDADDPCCTDRPVPDYVAALGTPVSGLRIGVVRNYFFDRNEEDVTAAVEAALSFYAAQGAQIVDLQIPNLAYGLGAIFAIELASSTAYHDQRIAAGLTERFQPDVRDLVEMGRFVTGPDYLRAEQIRTVLMHDFAKAFDEVDAIVGPATPLTAWRIGEWTVTIAGEEESVLAASWRLTFPFNLTGMPALTLPCGLDRRGLPIGLQIAARPFDEVMILRLAHAYEAAHEWKDRRPPHRVEQEPVQ